MKLSVNIPNPLNFVAQVYLDGVLQQEVIEVDSDAGYVEKYVLDEKGNPKINFSKYAFDTEIVHGDVKILVPGDEGYEKSN